MTRLIRRWLTGIMLLAFSLSMAASPAYGEKARETMTIRASSTITSNESGTVFEGLKISAGYLVVDITELGVAQTLQMTMQFHNPITDTWRTVIVGFAETTEAVHVGCIGIPVCSSGIMQTANRWAMELPHKWRLEYLLNNGTNATFSVVLIPYPQP